MLNRSARCSKGDVRRNDAHLQPGRRKVCNSPDGEPQKDEVDLPLALSAAQRIYGPTFNPQITLKALSFFDDGDLRLLPGIDQFTRQIDQDRGYEL